MASLIKVLAGRYSGLSSTLSLHVPLQHTGWNSPLLGGGYKFMEDDLPRTSLRVCFPRRSTNDNLTY